MERRGLPPIDAELVRQLIREQFPHWAELAVEPVLPGGWDNRMFRLGPDMLARLPSAAGYVAQVDKEHRFLPFLADKLPVRIPFPIAKGKPGAGFPWVWSVYRWIEGQTLSAAQVGDMTGLALAIAGFLRALHAIDAQDGPPAGAHNFHRGGQLAIYEKECRQALHLLADHFDPAATLPILELALSSHWTKSPVWVHGDLAPGNILLRNGRLHAVIDFGCCGTGDPACDLAIAWTFFSGESRRTFRDAVTLDEATWERAKGWTLWKAAITATGEDRSEQEIRKAYCVIADLVAD